MRVTDRRPRFPSSVYAMSDLFERHDAETGRTDDLGVHEMRCCNEICKKESETERRLVCHQETRASNCHAWMYAAAESRAPKKHTLGRWGTRARGRIV